MPRIWNLATFVITLTALCSSISIACNLFTTDEANKGSRSKALQLAERSIPRFAQVTPELFRSGQPGGWRRSKMNRSAVILKRLGIRTVVNLKRETQNERYEEAEFYKQHGIDYIHAGVTGRTPVSELLGIFADITTLLMSDNVAKPILVHCEEGRFRTGVVIAMYDLLSTNGAEVTEADYRRVISDYLKFARERFDSEHTPSENQVLNANKFRSFFIHDLPGWRAKLEKNAGFIFYPEGLLELVTDRSKINEAWVYDEAYFEHIFWNKVGSKNRVNDDI